MNKKITIPFSEQDIQELQNGEEFHWTFDGIDVHIRQENESDMDDEITRD